MRRVALCPGAFSPVRQVHVGLVGALLGARLFDAVLLVPGCSPRRDDAVGKALATRDGAPRLRAAERAARVGELRRRMQVWPNVEITALGVDSTSPYPVLDVLREASARSPGDAFALVMGGSRLEWMVAHASDELRAVLALVPLVVAACSNVGRARISHLTDGYPGCVMTLPPVQP